jgi:TRAP-type C4-dicarboxylate transport system permease small subunit
MPSAVAPWLIKTGRSVTTAGILVCGLIASLADGYPDEQRVFIVGWVILPFALAHWIGGLIAKTNASYLIVVFGIAAALLFGAWAYWDATWGPASRANGLAGLNFLYAPIFQLGGLAVVLAIAAIISRFTRRDDRSA